MAAPIVDVSAWPLRVKSRRCRREVLSEHVGRVAIERVTCTVVPACGLRRCVTSSVLNDVDRNTGFQCQGHHGVSKRVGGDPLRDRRPSGEPCYDTVCLVTVEAALVVVDDERSAGALTRR